MLIKQQSAIVVEATVSWEAPPTLASTAETKEAYYSSNEFTDALKLKLRCNEVHTLEVVVGASGFWPSSNRAIAELLKLKEKDIGGILDGCIKFGFSIHRQFMRVTWAAANRSPLGR